MDCIANISICYKIFSKIGAITEIIISANSFPANIPTAVQKICSLIVSNRTTSLCRHDPEIQNLFQN